MNGDSSIDPNLHDTIPTSRLPPVYASPAGETSTAAKPPPGSTPQSSYQQHLQQYAPYPQLGAYSHAYFSPPPGHQHAQIQSPNGFPAVAPPKPTPPGLHYVSTRSADAKRLRACEACRGLKVRCEPDPDGGPCKRCLKAGRKCEITPPSRKRQKKTDSRVSELEKQLADIQTQLRMRRQTGGSDSGGEQYDGDEDAAPLDAPDRHITSQPHHSQQPYGGKSAKVDDPSIYRSSQTPGHNRLHSGPASNRPVEAHMHGPPTQKAQAVTSTPSHPPPLPEEQVLVSVRTIASSMEEQLGADLLHQYMRTALPQSSSLDSAFSAKFELLRRSKPVLFVAIMMIMLQARCKDGTLPTAPDTKGGAPKTEDDQALHLLSEAAMGSGGHLGAKGDGHRNGVEKHDANLSNPANAFLDKMRAVDEKQLENDRWFEKMLQGFQ